MNLINKYLHNCKYFSICFCFSQKKCLFKVAPGCTRPGNFRECFCTALQPLKKSGNPHTILTSFLRVPETVWEQNPLVQFPEGSETMWRHIIFLSSLWIPCALLEALETECSVFLYGFCIAWKSWEGPTLVCPLEPQKIVWQLLVQPLRSHKIIKNIFSAYREHAKAGLSCTISKGYGFTREYTTFCVASRHVTKNDTACHDFATIGLEHN